MKFTWYKWDHSWARPMTKKEQVKYNFSLPWWKFLGLLDKMGFMKSQPPGSYKRLRNFTPFFWRNFVHKRELEYLKNKHKYELAMIDNKLHNSYIQGGSDFADSLLESFRH